MLTRWLLALGVLLLFWSTLHRAGPTADRPVSRSDLPVYLAGAEALAAGKDPLGATSPRGWPYVYPPTFAGLLVPLTALPVRVVAGMWFWVSLGAGVAGAEAFRRALGRRGPWSWGVEGVASALVLLPLASALERGQVSPLLLGLLGAASLALARGRDGWAGVAVGLATAIKVVPILALVALVLARRWRAVGAAVGGLIVFLGLFPAIWLGPRKTLEANRHWGEALVLESVRDPGAELSEASALRVHVNTNQSLTSAIARRTHGSLRALLLAGLFGVVLVPPLLLAARGPHAPSPTAWATVLVAILILSPVAWHHQHVLAWPALLVVASRLPRPSARWVLIAFALLSALHFTAKKTVLGDLGLLGLASVVLLGALVSTAHPLRPGGEGTPPPTNPRQGRRPGAGSPG